MFGKRLGAEFRNEILALSKIEHLNLVKLYGYVEHSEEKVVVVEYVGNGSLQEQLDGICFKIYMAHEMSFGILC